MSASRRSLSPRLAAVIAAAVVLVVAMLTISPWPVGIFEDDAMYTILAKSLAEGTGYRFLNLPGAPNATHYPPGYPAFLAMLWKLYPSFPDNIVLFKFANALLLGAAAYGAMRFARERLGLGTGGALGATLASMATIPILLITGLVLSEPLFLAMLLPTLLLAERTAERGTVREAVLTGLVIGVLSLVRTLGVFLLPAVALVLLLRRRPRAVLALIAGGAVALVPWQLWTAAHQADVPAILSGKYGSYVAWVLDGYARNGWPLLQAVFRQNVSTLVASLTYFLMPTGPAWPRMVALALLVVLAALALRPLWRRAPVMTLYVAAYLGVVLIWPFDPVRFVIGIAPLIAFIVAMGVGVVREWRPSTPVVAWARRASLAGCLALAAGFTVYNARGVRGRWWESMQRDAGTRAKPVVEWVARYTRPGDVLAVDHELLVYLYAGRQAVPYQPFTPTEYVRPLTDAQRDSGFREMRRTYPVRFLIAGSAPGIELGQRLAETEPANIRLLGRLPTAEIFEIERP